MSTIWNPITKASGTIWTNVPKANVPAATPSGMINPGNPIGFLLALTYSTSSVIPGGGWSNVNKAIVPTSWTNVPKVT